MRVEKAAIHCTCMRAEPRTIQMHAQMYICVRHRLPLRMDLRTNPANESAGRTTNSSIRLLPVRLYGSPYLFNTWLYHILLMVDVEGFSYHRYLVQSLVIPIMPDL